MVDECIQFFLPSRTFDWFDILGDLVASVLAVGSSGALRWVGRTSRHRRSRNATR